MQFLHLWENVFPFISTFKKVDKATVRSDMVAGLTVALILIPQSLAYAQLAGLPIQYGLFASLLPPVVAAFYGSSRYLSTGPVAIVSLITATSLASLHLANPNEVIQHAILLAFLVGLLQLSLGVFKLGVVVNFISHPVIVGFSNAAAIIIAFSQLPKIFSISLPPFEHQYEAFYHLLLEIPTQTHFVSLMIGICSFFFLYLIKQANKRLPNILLTVVIMTVFASVIEFAAAGGSIVGNVPSGLPAITTPNVSISVIPSLFNAAMVIALLGFMESISVAKALASKTGERVNPNQELIGQGLANVIGSFSNSYPVSGSFSRSAVNYQAGAQTALASLFVSIFVLLTLLFFTPLLYFIPQPVLAAVIIFSVVGLIRFQKIMHAWHTNKSDGIIAGITFVSTLLFAPDLDKGIFLGVILSIGYYLYSRSRPRIVTLSRGKDGMLQNKEINKIPTCRYISVIRFDGSLFFANDNYLETRILDDIALHPKLTKYVVLIASGINYIDYSGVEMLSTLTSRLRDAKKDIVFVDVKANVMETMKKAGLHEKIGEKNFFVHEKDALLSIFYDAHRSNHEDKCPLMV